MEWCVFFVAVAVVVYFLNGLSFTINCFPIQSLSFSKIMLAATHCYYLVWVWPFFVGRACTAADRRVFSTVISKVQRGRRDIFEIIMGRWRLTWSLISVLRTNILSCSVDIRWPPVQQLWRQLTADAWIISSGRRRICDRNQCLSSRWEAAPDLWLEP